MPVERLFDTAGVMSALYDAAYARRYRRPRRRAAEGVVVSRARAWVGEVCERFDHPIDVLDLGCGTGRYFWGLRKVNTLTGLDASAPMLAEARHPTRAGAIRARQITLVKGDLATHQFPRRQFRSRVFDRRAGRACRARRARWSSAWRRWLKPGGRFAFTTIDPQSPDVPATWQRRVATAMLPIAPGPIGDALHRRLMVGGMYGDERWIRRQLRGLLAIETIERFRSDVHLHGRCVARKPVAPKPRGEGGMTCAIRACW